MLNMMQHWFTPGVVAEKKAASALTLTALERTESLESGAYDNRAAAASGSFMARPPSAKVSFRDAGDHGHGDHQLRTLASSFYSLQGDEVEDISLHSDASEHRRGGPDATETH
eukprot:gene19760-14358_t